MSLFRAGGGDQTPVAAASAAANVSQDCLDGLHRKCPGRVYPHPEAQEALRGDRYVDCACHGCGSRASHQTVTRRVPQGQLAGAL